MDLSGRPWPVGERAQLLTAGAAEPALRLWLERHGTLMAAAEAHPQVEALEGRGRVAVVPDPVAPSDGGADRWVVRHYHRGGSVARLLGDRYLRVGEPRPFRELRVLEAVRARGVPAPEPVGAAVYPAGPFYRGDLVTRWVPASVDLASLLFNPMRPSPVEGPVEETAGHPVGADSGGGLAADPAGDTRLAAMRATGRLVRLLHDRGVAHPDLNLKNVLLVSPAGAARAGREPEAVILDLDRTRLHDGSVPARSRQAMISRFWRSARKWERRAGRPLPASLRMAFDAAYAAGG
jgi:3-deoxy-D-manno-octulosonic acid kinase